MYLDDHDPLSVLYNNTPQEDLCGMTPSEIHHLLYDGWTDLSPLKVLPEIANHTLDAIPYFRFVEELVRIVSRDQPLKLTSLGYLPVKINRELYDHRFITDWYIDLRKAKTLKEFDSAAISSAHSIVKMAGLVKKGQNKLYLTKKGEQLLQPEKRVGLLREILMAFTQKWDWGSLDGYEEAYGIQQLWGFSVHLLFEFGHTAQPITFYSEKFLMGFPLIAEQFPMRPYSNPLTDFQHCYATRTFNRFFE